MRCKKKRTVIVFQKIKHRIWQVQTYYKFSLIFFQEKSQLIYDYFSKNAISLQNKIIIAFCRLDLVTKGFAVTLIFGATFSH